MPHSHIPSVYWDTNIWLALLKGEQLGIENCERIREAARRIDCREQLLIVSQPARTEIFSHRLSDDAKTRFTRLLDSRKVQWLDMGPGAYEVRDTLLSYYSHENGYKKNLDRDDADNLAVAIHYEVSEFYTFDNGGKGGASLLSLNGTIADKFILKICRPPLPKQTKLAF